MRLIWMGLCFSMVACGSPLANSKQEDALSDPSEDRNVVSKDLFSGCPITFKDLPLCADIRWFDDFGKAVQGPIYWEEKFWDAEMSAIIRFWHREEAWPIDPIVEFPEVKTVMVKLFMPTHGHGSDLPIVETLPNRVGQFRVSGIKFIMACDEENPWEVRLQLKTSSKTENENEDAHDPLDVNIFAQSILEFKSVERR